MGSYDAPDDFSKSDYIWPWCYFIMFGCFYLTDFTAEEQEDMYQGIMNGVILAFCIPGILLRISTL